MEPYRNEKRFHVLTGMMPPGRNESPESIPQNNYSRIEVRFIMWELFSQLQAEIDKLRAEIERMKSDQTNDRA